MTFPHLLAWFPMLAIAITNGALREKVYGRGMTELRAHQVSSLLACFLFLIYAVALHTVFPFTTRAQAMQTGGVWVVLTVAFECWMVLRLKGETLGKLLADYDLRRGRLWLVVLLTVGLAPMVARLF